MLRLLIAPSKGYVQHGLMMVCTAFALGGCLANNQTGPKPEEEDRERVTLTIDLQDGFVDDTVVLRINGEEAFRKQAVGTKLLLGFADSFKTEIEKGQIRLAVRVDTRDVEEVILLDLSRDTYIGISLDNGTIQYVVSKEPFGYG